MRSNAFPGLARILAAALCCACAQLAPAPRSPDPAPTAPRPPASHPIASHPVAPKGHLVIVGGGGTPEAVAARAIELAGGAHARGLILPQASQRPEAGVESAEFWRTKGLAEVASLDLADPDAARAAIAKADFIWFPGGDQSRLLAAIDEAGVADAIRSRYAEGAVVGGTSAGAAVMSQRMIVGGETADLTVVRAASVAMVDGLGLLPGTIVDQHFLRRQRFNRLLSAVIERPDLVGIGIDEKTAIVVTGETFEVVGESGVLVLDARRARPPEAAPGAPVAADDLRAALLRDGMRYDLSGP